MGQRGDITYLVSGAGGQLREQAPDGFATAGTRAWSAQAHLVLGRIDEVTLAVTPVAAVSAEGCLEAVTPTAPDGSLVKVPLVVSLRDSGVMG